MDKWVTWGVDGLNKRLLDFHFSLPFNICFFGTLFGRSAKHLKNLQLFFFTPPHPLKFEKQPSTQYTPKKGASRNRQQKESPTTFRQRRHGQRLRTWDGPLAANKAKLNISDASKAIPTSWSSSIWSRRFPSKRVWKGDPDVWDLGWFGGLVGCLGNSFRL